MRVLFIATRVPYGQMHGHKMGIRTYIHALKALEHQVTIAAFSVPGDTFTCEDLDAKTYYLTFPSYWTILTNLVKYGLPKLKSINECLYLDRGTFRRVREICQTHNIQLVVADMIRTAAYAEAVGLPWILNHGDLLSDRYRMWATRASGSESILGYLAAFVPNCLRPSVGRLFRMLLKREAMVIESREIYWTSKSLSSSLVSLQETRILADRVQRRVFCMPLTVPIPKKSVNDLSHRPMSAVFTGGITYQPNLDALRTYVEKVLPAFARLNVEPPRLSIIGSCPESLRNGLEHPAVRFLGYVPDINEELRRHQVFFAPIVSGTGVKTKVLEAMACGLPVIALQEAVNGLSVESFRHCLVAEGPEEFVQCYLSLVKDPEFAERVGSAGRELVVRSYSIEAATEILRAELVFTLSGGICSMSSAQPFILTPEKVDQLPGSRAFMR